MTTSDEARGELLVSLARSVLEHRLLGRVPPSQETAPWLDEPGAVFVTLMLHGELRGCVGSLEATSPLGQDVAANAVAAALRDPRFPPVSPDEVEELSIEISVLEAPEPWPVASEAEVLEGLRPGIDGLILEHAGGRATFLPQVWDQLPESASFLRQLKRKAGLSAAAWDDSFRLSRYRVAKWRESKDRP